MFALSKSQRKMSVSSQESGGLEDDQGVQRRRVEYVEGNLKICETMEVSSEVMCLRYTPDGDFVAVGLSKGSIKVFNPDTGQCMYSLTDDDTTKSHLPVTSIRYRPVEEIDKVEHKHILMATYASGFIKFWHYTSGKCLMTVNEGRQTLASAFSPSGNRFITAGADPEIRLYDMETKHVIQVLEPSDSRDIMNGHRARVFAVQYHPLDAHTFISGGWDDTVQFWDDRQKHAVRKLFGPHICGDSLDIDPVHNHILTGSWRKQAVLQIWDFATGNKIKDVPEDSLQRSLLYCVQWLGRENILCGGCEQNMARVIDRGTLNTVGQLVDLPNGVYCIDNERHGVKPKIAVGAANKVYILKIEKKSG